MDFFLYIMLFMMGTVFGSFFTLAVYRIPLKKDITHERSFCPNCNHRLEFLDLIPIVSYIALKGKCRYCKEKIRIRYLVLEMLSGLVFLASYLVINMRFPNYDLNKIVYYISFVLMYVTIAITIGIDNEYKKINLNVILFGIVSQVMYIVYLYIFEKNINIYRYGIYVLLIAILFILNKFIKNNRYIFEILVFIAYLLLCLEIKYLAIVLIISIIVMGIFKLIISKKEKIKLFNYGTILGISMIVVTIIKNYYIYH